MNFLQKNVLLVRKTQALAYIAWIQALVSTAFSLYFSQILLLPPCILCWYQRIFMYPLTIILTIGILQKDRKVYRYVLPLSITGGLIAIYHNLLYYKILPESAAPCTLGISCTTKLIEWGGFITIPLLSLAAFSVITICMLVLKKNE